jgi:outer membrane protein
MIGWLSAIALSTSVLAQVDSVAPLVEQRSSSLSPTVVQLSLTDVISLLLQNNRDLKNAALDRIIQHQQLREAESIFTPTIRPTLGLGISETLSQVRNRSIIINNAPFVQGTTGTDQTTTNGLPSNSISNPISNSISNSTSSSSVDSTAQLVGQLRTRLGSTLTVTVNPFESGEQASITLTQPLLRGFGSSVNEAPVNQARLTETRNSLELRRVLTQKITDVSIAYRALATAQAALKIQQLSLEDQRKQLEFVQVLVNAGRRARVDLIEVEASVAATEAEVLAAQNSLEQAKTDLLNLLDLEQPLNIAVPEAAIAQVREEAVDPENPDNFNLDSLLQTAYANRPDYLQAQLDIQIAESTRLVAQDNQRWGLDLQTTTSIGDTSQIAAGLTLTRLFEDQSLVTTATQAEVGVLQRQNDLAKITDDIRLDVTSRLRDVNSALEQITATRQSRELAERRLEVANVRLRRGDIDIFQVLDIQNSVVVAQNAEVNARIEFLDATARLEQAIGTTLDAWQAQVAASGLLVTPP